MARGKKKEKELTPEEKLQQTLVPLDEQPYEIPENWCWVKFGDVCFFQNGYAFKSQKFSKDTGIPIIRISDISDNLVSIENAVKTTEIEVDSHYIVSAGDLLIAMSGATTGKSGIYTSNKKAYLNQRVGNIKIKNESALTQKFRNYYIESKTEEILRNAYGGAQPNISSTKICKMAFPLPPILEQQRIVNRIESLFAKLDEAKEKAQAVVDGFEDRKAAILHKAFTGELTEGWRRKNKVNSGQWINKKLRECGSWMGGGTPSMAHPEYWENGDILWITSKDMKTDIIEDTLMHTNMAGVSNSSAVYNDKPSILFVMRSGILRRTLPIAMVTTPFTVNQDLKAMSPEGIHLEYLFWACECNEKNILNTCMKSGTTVESINATALMEYEIPIAPKKEQFIIVEIIKALLDNEQRAKEAAEKVVDQIGSMKKSILARAFRGELGTNDPTDESSAKLLKRIL